MIIHYQYYWVWKYLAFAVLAVTLPIAGLVALKIIQKLSSGRCRSKVCLVGKTAIVTGGATGIGYETALALASRGCRVIIADKVDATKAINRITQHTNNTNVVLKYLDLSSFQSVRKFAKDINSNESRLDILINNAGVGTAGNKHTDDGLNVTMQINHFGPFLLTHLLTDLLKKSAPSRIIFVSSASAFVNNLSLSNLNPVRDHPLNIIRTSFIYGNSKLCNIITANCFAEKLKDSGVTSNSLHPGLVFTDIYNKSARLLGLETLSNIFKATVVYIYGKSVEEGAQTTIHLACSNKMAGVTGKHFWDCRSFPLPPGAWNKKFCADVWEETEKLVQLKEEEKI
ncbi:retinol dehydrogenase 12 [Aethina tumida]|uniref:retinol dehydrogenase 12 n=1 Tax=Aethina tumida TaxID=116153 RepID=UPI002148AF8B|nr:retinol dehydrogenase 12 [Aethina tumida]